MLGPVPHAAMPRKTHLDTLALITLLACCALWGLNQVASKIALAEVPPLWQAGLRYGHHITIDQGGPVFELARCPG